LTLFEVLILYTSLCSWRDVKTTLTLFMFSHNLICKYSSCHPNSYVFDWRNAPPIMSFDSIKLKLEVTILYSTPLIIMVQLNLMDGWRVSIWWHSPTPLGVFHWVELVELLLTFGCPQLEKKLANASSIS